MDIVSSHHFGSVINDNPKGDGLWELMEKHGAAFNMRVLWDDFVLTTSPEHIKLILATDFKNYAKGRSFTLRWVSIVF